METQTIELSERESEFVRRSVLEGRYKDANEVVEAGLRLLEEREEEERLALERLRAEVKKGMDDLEAGRYVEINGPEEMSLVFDEVKRRVAARALGAALDVQAPQV
jgi:antitoxin ParD1/3/4